MRFNYLLTSLKDYFAMKHFDITSRTILTRTINKIDFPLVEIHEGTVGWAFHSQIFNKIAKMKLKSSEISS